MDAQDHAAEGPHPLRYRILGPVDTLSGGRRVAMPGAKVRTLLALLVVNANQPAAEVCRVIVEAVAEIRGMPVRLPRGSDAA